MGSDKINGFIKNPKNFLIYLGNPGLGKTYFCAAIFDYAVRNFNTVRYWSEAGLLKKTRASIDQYKYSDYLDYTELLIDDEFVIIDDVGSTGFTEWRKEVLFFAIDKRYNSGLPTVITSNFSMKEFKDLFPERLGSRLNSSENCIIEIMDGPDLRQQGY